IKVRDAGEYSATFKIEDKINYEWTDGTQTDHSATFTVTAKELTVTYTTDKPTGGMSWSADKSYKATFTISGVYNGDGTATPAVAADQVKLKVTFTKDGDSTFTGSVSATGNGDGTYTAELDNTAFPGGVYAVGAYPIKVEFESSGTGNEHNANYSLSTANTGLNNLKLTISAASVSFTSPQWQYAKGTNGAQNVPSDNKFKYEYDASTSAGAVYTITADTSGFASQNIAIDTSKYTNGYQNAQASSAGTYTTTVALKTTATGFVFSNGQATMDFTYTWEIEKADYDFTNVKWQYTDTSGNTLNYPARWNATNSAWEYLDEDGNVVSDDPGIPWFGENYTLTLTGLPTGVTINNPTNAYNGTNKKKYVGSYQTECAGLNCDTSNYNAVPANLLKLDWKIVKAKIKITTTSWTTEQAGGSASGVNLFYVPVLQNIAGVEYEYYDLGTSGSGAIAFPGTLLGSVNDIDAVVGTEHNYYVVAKVKTTVSTDGVTLWSDAIELVDETGGITENGVTVECAKKFMTGDSRTPVQVTLNGAPYTYDGSEHGKLDDGTNGGELSIEVAGTGNNFAASNFTVTYYEYNENGDNHKGMPLGAGEYPTQAGKYVIEIQLTSVAEENYYATAKYVEFEIKPYVLDMSQVKWGYLDAEGNEAEYNPASPLEYGLDGDGNPIKHNLILIGLPKGDVNGDQSEQLQAKMYEESGLGNDGSD
ncbi:MAG: hypothetical protein K2H43_03750, partial [Clostridia bacterium]|nr:hypothetical protein [Clostridia bacterium]